MTADGGNGGGGPMPVPHEHQSRPREDERTTRKPLQLWDRLKILILLTLGFAALVWATYAQFRPLITWPDALRQTAKSGLWLLVLIALEALRQIHILIAEHSEGYYRATNHLFGGLERRTSKMNAWHRYRIARAAKFGFILLILDLALARTFKVSAATALFTLPERLVGALPQVFQYGIYILLLILQFVGLFYFLSRGGVDVYFPDDIRTRFTDVWGQDAVLGKVKENIVFLEDPESIEDKGGHVPGGVLLWGPPGTGKTLMAEAVAGETGRPFVFVDPGAFTQMFMGVGILKVKSLFRKLRKLSLRYGGVIVFFDEADSLGNRGMSFGGQWATPAVPMQWSAPACNGLSYLSAETAWMLLHDGLGPSRADATPRSRRDGIMAGLGGMGGGGGMGTLQALLSELSGMKKPRGFINRVVRRTLGMRPKPPPKYRILVMMATNMPEALDEALLRPGRIDRIYKVGYPSKAGRMKTYQGYLEKIQHNLTEEDVDKLATITPYATGASIKDLVNEALITAIRDGRDRVEWRDIVKAKHLKDLGPPEDVEYIERERHAIAVHEACHAVVAYRVRHHLTIDIATIEKGGSYLGMVSSVKPEDIFTRWRSEFEADVMVSLASLAGERMFFGADSSAGVAGDLQSATFFSSAMEAYWGMGETVASHAVTRSMGIPGPRPEEHEGNLLTGTLGRRIEKRLAELLTRTESLLAENRAEILALAYALEAHKTMTGEDVIAVISGEQGPLIDGRPMHAAEFTQRLEEYHGEVLAAHEGHEPVRVPLPAITGHYDPQPVSTNGEPHDAPEPVGAEDAPGPDGPADGPPPPEVS
jgi:cell division protease FtsH